MLMIENPKYMKAAILVAQNEPLIVDTVELPNELGVGQVLVEVHKSGICGSQLGEIAGVKGPDNYLPHLLGHEGCATVLAIGPGVKYVQPKDKVVLHWRKGLGIQGETPKYKWRGQELNAGWVTTFNTHAIVSENRCTKVPQNTDQEIAALFGCAITTGFGVVTNNARMKIGDKVIIYGAGGIGLNIIQAASMVSAFPIIAVDIFENRLNLASKFGATHTINGSIENPFEAIKNIMGNESIDVFVDNTGLTKIIEEGFDLLGRNGKVVLVGVPKIGENINIHSLPLHFGKSIKGSHGGEAKPELDIPRYLTLVNNGKLNLEGLISARYNLDEINQAIDSIKKGESAGRVMISL